MDAKRQKLRRLDGLEMSFRRGCILVSAPMPMSAMEFVATMLPKSAVMDLTLARMAGVGFAYGAPEDTKAFKEDLKPHCIRAARERYGHVAPGVAEWVGAGEHGNSSVALLYGTLGVRVPGMRHGSEVSFPHDADDFSRCVMLAEAVPEVRRLLGKMSSVSPVWKAIVSNWDTLQATLDQECPAWRTEGGSAPTTTEMLRKTAAEAGPQSPAP